MLYFFSAWSGAKINQQRWSDGWTVTHVAAMAGEEATLRMLVEAGANTSLRDNEDRTPEVIATRFGRSKIADICAGASPAKFRRERQIKRVENNEKSELTNSLNSNNGENSWGIHENIDTVTVVNNINEVIERRRLERAERKRKQQEEEKKFQDEVDFETSLHDESIWALTLEKEQAEENGDQSKVLWCNVRIKEETELKSQVSSKKELEWKKKEKREKELKQQLHSKLKRDGVRNKPAENEKVNNLREENFSNPTDLRPPSSADPPTADDTRKHKGNTINVNDKVLNKTSDPEILKVPEQIEYKTDLVRSYESTPVEVESSKRVSTFTKVFAVGALAGIILHYMFAE